MKIDTNETLFEHAITAEKAAQEFYLGLTKKFSHLSEVSDFWKEMLKDEIEHAKELKDIRDSLMPNKLFAPANPFIMQKAKRVLRFSIKNKLNYIRDLDDAYQLAHELENSEANTVFEFLRCFMSHNEWKKFVISGIEDHLSKLMEFPQTFGDVIRRKSIRVSATPAPV